MIKLRIAVKLMHFSSSNFINNYLRQV